MTSLGPFTGLGVALVPDDPGDDPDDPGDDPDDPDDPEDNSESELRLELELESEEPLLDPAEAVLVLLLASPTAVTGTETTVVPGPLLTGQVHWHVPVLASAVIGLLVEIEAITALALSPAVAVMAQQLHTRRPQCNGDQMDAWRSVPGRVDRTQAAGVTFDLDLCSLTWIVGRHSGARG